MAGVSLEADCSRCAGLCCAALAFDKSELFAIDKKADEPCPNLEPGARCSIHAHLADVGYEGCVLYTCDGAGQRVTQEVFAGASWQDQPELLSRMTASYRVMKKIHNFLVLLEAAAKLPLSEADMLELKRFRQEIDPIQGWSEDSLKTFEKADLASEIRRFLAGLRAYVEKKQT